ncbi:hypothetical protein BT93_L0599 [Corymbia citriodora subsp. variegata]|uniref:Cytochrome P450 n=1 Tax=Corymbia citriodora subsp. variegata TaxID=360336 RepID=A0A8T0CWW0_CORYI|nr:hypothetical protein BT93_L0599 [Corymbia citriodora subsp. variegata]
MQVDEIRKTYENNQSTIATYTTDLDFLLLLLLLNHVILDFFSSLSHFIIFPSLFIITSLVFFFKSPSPLPNWKRLINWTTDLIRHSPLATYLFHRPLGRHQVFTGNAANVQHILKTHFGNYEKGGVTKTTFWDLLGARIFNVDGEFWKFQRQVSSHEFNTRSLRKFVETVVDDAKLNERLLPLLALRAKSGAVIDMQDILQRFALTTYARSQAFEDAVKISTERFVELFSVIWRIKRFFNVGFLKRLQITISEKRELSEKSSAAEDLLSRFLSSGHSDEDFVVDIVISFILASRDTTSAALTWYSGYSARTQRWRPKSGSTGYDDVKELVYTHASLYESMQIYPLVPLDTKEEVRDDVLEDGTLVKKGTRMTYHPYAMGRLEELWGKDWPEFMPERWLKAAEDGGEKWVFVGRDAFTYPAFQAGPRTCLGKEMAFVQMKRLVAGGLQQFKVVPAEEEGAEPVFDSYLTSKAQGGFPVRIEVRG